MSNPTSLERINKVQNIPKNTAFKKYFAKLNKFFTAKFLSRLSKPFWDETEILEQYELKLKS